MSREHQVGSGCISWQQCQVATDLVEAVKNYDGDTLVKLQKEQIFTFLQVEAPCCLLFFFLRCV